METVERSVDVAGDAFGVMRRRVGSTVDAFENHIEARGTEECGRRGELRRPQ